MPTSLQVGASSPYGEEMASKAVIALASNTVSVGVSETDAQGGEIEATGAFQSVLYVLTHDATAGVLTINLDSSSTTGAPYTEITDEALLKGEALPSGPSASLSVDASVVANQGQIIVAISPSARVTSGGVFVEPLQAFHALRYNSDGSWNGTEVVELALGMHVPKAAPTAE